MVVLPIVVGAAVTLGALTALSPKRTPVGKFLGTLSRGDYFRVWTRLPEAVISAQQTGEQARLFALVEGDLGSLGFDRIMLVVQDPSTPRVFTAIARWGGKSELPVTGRASPLDIFHVEKIEAPPAEFTEPPEAPSPRLDLGLTQAEEQAITYALTHETNPKHLSAFASVLLPDFPIAASLLHAKSKLAELRSTGANKSVRKAFSDEMRRRAFAVKGWALAETCDPLLDLVGATDGLVGASVWETFAGVLKALPGPNKREAFLRLAIESEGSDASVALAQPSNVAKSERVKLLEKSGFCRLHSLARGNSLEEQAASVERHFGSPSVKGALVRDLGRDLATVPNAMPLYYGTVAKLIEEPELLQRFPRDLAVALAIPEPVAHAALASTNEVAQGIVIVDADTLRALVPAGGLVSPARLVDASFHPRIDTLARTSVSPSALQMAYSAFRPTVSNVLRAPKAHVRLKGIKEMAKRGDPEAVRAKRALDRAGKLLERQKWASWYRRIREESTGPRTRKLTGRL